MEVVIILALHGLPPPPHPSDPDTNEYIYLMFYLLYNKQMKLK